MSLLRPIRNFYARFERPISSLSLVSGFVFDAFTLKRVDTPWENIWITFHLVVVAIFIVLIHAQENKKGDEENPKKKHFWYVNILQFFFGGILSTYLVFYFRSTDFLSTWPFLALLVTAFIANESLKRHYIRFSFQVSLFFLSIYSFAIFIVPVVLHKIGVEIFILSGIISLVFISIFTKILFKFVKEKSAKDKKESKRIIGLVILSIFIVVNMLYFTNLIPPIPLSLKDAGAYHSIERNPDGNYAVTYEDYGWESYFKLYPDFHTTPNTAIYSYSAIFSPKGLDLTIRHEWQRYDESSKKWVTDSIISLPVIGGRDGGFRTFSVRSNLPAGKWRVSIENELGQVIGHIGFNVVPSDTEPALTKVEKE